MRTWKLGEICVHDTLGRKCELCAAEDDIADLRARIARLQAEVKAWRDAKDEALDWRHDDYRYSAWEKETSKALADILNKHRDAVDQHHDLESP